MIHPIFQPNRFQCMHGFFASFFCGNIRRDELPQLLKSSGIALEEMVVYETTVTPHPIIKDYHAVLFFSPSAVDSFFSVNKVVEHTILFAIGNTTARAIGNYSTNTIVKADTPEKDNLVKKAIAYFQNEFATHNL